MHRQRVPVSFCSFLLRGVRSVRHSLLLSELRAGRHGNTPTHPKTAWCRTHTARRYHRKRQQLHRRASERSVYLQCLILARCGQEIEASDRSISVRCGDVSVSLLHDTMQRHSRAADSRKERTRGFKALSECASIWHLFALVKQDGETGRH